MSSDDGGSKGRRASRWPVVIGVLVAVALGLLVFAISQEGQDRTVTGTVTDVHSHRVCVADRAGARSCAQADTPERLMQTAVGDCVRLRSSVEGVLISIERERDACPTP